MSEDQVVTYELDGDIALIGLNRPAKRNALSPALMAQLREAVIRAGEEAKCGILFGHGEDSNVITLIDRRNNEDVVWTKAK